MTQDSPNSPPSPPTYALEVEATRVAGLSAARFRHLAYRRRRRRRRLRLPRLDVSDRVRAARPSGRLKPCARKSCYHPQSLLEGGISPLRHHISSAVVVALPARREEVRRRLRGMPGVEVHAGEGSRIVVTIEGPSSGMLGETLDRISIDRRRDRGQHGLRACRRRKDEGT